MKVAEVMIYFARLKGIAADVAQQRAAELLQRYGLGDYRDRRCEVLSKGMEQKVQLLAALIHEPELVILDEPFSGLDPVNRDLMRDVILQMRRDGKTVIFSTHLMEQAEQLCDYVALINKGRRSSMARWAKCSPAGDAPQCSTTMATGICCANCRALSGSTTRQASRAFFGRGRGLASAVGCARPQGADTGLRSAHGLFARDLHPAP